MNPVKTVFTTRVLGEEQGYIPLPVCDEIMNGQPVIYSFWKPSAEELKALNEGRFVRMMVLGGQPPIMLDVHPDILQHITAKVS